MPSAALTSLVDALRQYRLLEPAQLDDISEGLLTACPDPKALARELIQRGWLTAYQVNLLLLGRGQELVLGSYLLLERLGEGGMGQVFKARQRNLGRTVAVKLIRKERLDRADAVRRFQREVRAAAVLSHPNIVPAYDADQIGGTHFLVMEYIEGAIDLGRLVQTNGPLPVAQACTYIRQAALALQHACERGMVHRDVKPANLLRTADGKVVKLLDLGLARLDQPADDGERSATMTQEGTVMGTPDYIAPEQALKSHTVDIRADLYSLGCTFYYLLTGRVPFPGGSVVDKLLRHQREQPPAVETLRPEVPGAVARVLRKLMAKKPAERYQTPAEVAAVLEELGNATGEPSTTLQEASLAPVNASPAPGAATFADTLDSPFAHLASGDTAHGSGSVQSLDRSTRGRRWLRFGAAGAALLLAGAAIWLSLFSQQPPEETAKEKERHSPVVVRDPPRKPDDPLKQSAALLGGKWYYIGPFDNPEDMKGFDTVYPPEKEIDLQASYPGKGNQPVKWTVYPQFQVGSILDFLPLFEPTANQEMACLYLYHEIEVAEATSVPVSLGSDDTLTVWLNQKRLLSVRARRGVQPDDNFTTLRLKPGKNQLLVKICQDTKHWGFYVAPWKGWFYEQEASEDWVMEVAGLSAAKQVEAVTAKLMELNRGYDGIKTYRVENGVVTEFGFSSMNVVDLSPVRALTGLKKLSCQGLAWNQRGKIPDLAPLQGMALTSLRCANNKITDLSPLKGMDLVELHCANNGLGDLSPLRGMKLTSLEVTGNPVSDLSHLKDLKLHYLSLGWTQVADLAPLKDMPLIDLSCNNTQVANLTPLKAMKLRNLSCGYSKVSDLSPLRDMTLNSLRCEGTRVADLAPLRDMKLTYLNCGRTPVSDLSPLKEMNLTSLSCYWTQVFDLSPLKGMKLTFLDCGGTQVSNLLPLKGMKLTTLRCAAAPVADLSLLKDMPLKDLRCDFQPDRDSAIVRSLNTLETINDRPAEEFWHVVAAQAQPLSAEWLKEVAGLSGSKQVAAVAAKLQERNPGFDGAVTPKYRGGVATTLEFLTDFVTDLSPVRALSGLRTLVCRGSAAGKGLLADLSPLKDLELTTLYCDNTRVFDLSPLKTMNLRDLRCSETPVSDLSPLAAMKLTILHCQATRVTDLSPLKKMSLKELRCDFWRERDTEILRSLTTLEKINGKPTIEFWKEVKAR